MFQPKLLFPYSEEDEVNRMGLRQLSVSSDSRLLEDEIKQEVKVILRPKKPPRPQSEVFLDQVDKRRTKRYSAFGVSRVLHTVHKSRICVQKSRLHLKLNEEGRRPAERNSEIPKSRSPKIPKSRNP